MRYEDEIYHSGYLDGYYASMELYHSDEEMSEEEKRARRKRRRRNIALGIAGAAGVAGAGYYGYKKMQKANEEMGDTIDRVTEGIKRMKSAPKPKRNIPGFKGTTGTYKLPSTSYDWIPFDVERNRKLRNRKGFTSKPKPKPKRNIPGFIRNPGTYKINPVTGDFGSYLTLHGMHIKARQRPYKK